MSRSSPSAGSVVLTPEDVALIAGCMDTLALMAASNHIWTEGERAIYEEARIALGLGVNRTDENGNDGWEDVFH